MPPRRRAKAAAASSSKAVAAPSALASMLSRTEELTALFETLGVLSCALMACLSRGWCTAIDEARAQISSVEAIDDDWVRQQLLLWAERHHKRVKNFQSDFLMSVLPRFYTGLGKLHIGLLPRRDTDTGSPYRRYRRFPKVDLRFPALDEALKHLTLRCTQLRELDVALGRAPPQARQELPKRLPDVRVAEVLHGAWQAAHWTSP